jgi:uncharacterized protein YndB with AHSA1/START domain
MALNLSQSVLIEKPAEEVWADLTDENNDPVWLRPYCRQVKRLGPHAEGTRFEGVDNMGSYVNVVTRYEPPTRLSWREESPRAMQQRERSYLLAREDDATRMTLDISYQTNGIQGN